MQEYTKEEFDNLRVVVTSLRYDCQKVKSAKRAILVISKKTGLTMEVVKQVLVKIGKLK